MSNKRAEDQPPAWGWFTTNFRISILLVIAIVVFGVFAVFQMPKESSPEIDVPVAVITTTLPGASATDVEQLVTNPIEDNVENLSDISELDSVSETGFSQIIVQFDVGVDKAEVISNLRNEVDAASSELPDDANEPNVQEVSFADQPAVTYAISGPYELPEIGRFAERLANEFESIENVSAANVSGEPDKEFAVTFRQADLDQYQLSIGQVVNQIQQANTDIPIGTVESDGSVYTVRFAGRLENADDIRNVPVVTTNNDVVQLKEVASVTETYAPVTVRNQLAQDGGQLQPAVSIDIFKEAGVGSIVTVVNEAKNLIASADELGIPDDVIISTTRNLADQIASDLSNLLNSGIVTMAIIFTVLVLFLGWREAVLASLSIPIAFLIGLGVLYTIGYTINSLTLFSLILVIGILVDAAIVITEGFSGELDTGLSPQESAFNTLSEFQVPLTAGTLTTVFAFAPMLLAGGIIGEFIATIPVTVSVVLLSALFVALGLIPAFAVRFFPASSTKISVTKWTQKRIERIYDTYSEFLKGILTNTRRRTYIFVAMTVLFIASVALPVTGVLKTALFPAPNLDTVTVNAELPAGTALGVTNQEVEKVANQLQTKDYVESLLASAGASSNTGLVTAGGGSPNIGGIVVSLVSADNREMTSEEIVADLNNSLPEVTTADIEVSQQTGGPPSGKPVQINLSGGSLSELESSARTVLETLNGIPGVVNAESDLSVGGSELVATVDRSAASRAGISPQTVATNLRARVSGIEATTVKTDGEDIPVQLLYEGSRSESGFGRAGQVRLSELSGTTLRTTQGSLPLSNVTEFSLDQSLPAINHSDGVRQISVSADTEPDTTAGAVLGQFQNTFDDSELPDPVDISFGGEQQDVQESFTDLFLAMIVGIILIFGLLTWQFNSFKQPLYMVATIPLSFIGVAFGLTLVGQPLSFPAFIGVVALAGIVVNNAIILIDRVNNNRDDTRSLDAAIYEGARSRVQPIILTTITTAGGVAPLLFADPTWAPLAWAIIFGLTFSTILTLVVVPLLYQRFSG